MDILFPKIVDNHYKGHKIVLWILGFYVVKSFLASGIHMFAADGGAQSIGSITLDAFTQGGADSVITIFSLWGMEQFVIGIIVLVILWRYKSLIPFAWAIYSIEYLGRFFIPMLKPGFATDHVPPGAILDYILVPLAILMFVISIYTSKKTSI